MRQSKYHESRSVAYFISRTLIDTLGCRKQRDTKNFIRIYLNQSSTTMHSKANEPLHLYIPIQNSIPMSQVAM